MSAMPKTIITNTDQTHELTAVFNHKIERLEKHIEMLKRSSDFQRMMSASHTGIRGGAAMSGAVLMNITIDLPPTQLSRSARVAYALHALETVKLELGRCGGNDSTGSIIGQDSAGVPNQSLGSWSFDASPP
jgi:hypothetical protein